LRCQPLFIQNKWQLKG